MATDTEWNPAHVLWVCQIWRVVLLSVLLQPWMPFRSHLPPVNCHVYALEESSRCINKAEKMSFPNKIKNLWVPSAPSGGHHGHENYILEPPS